MVLYRLFKYILILIYENILYYGIVANKHIL